MVRCLLVDDEPLALSLLEGYLKQTDSLEHAGSCKNATEAYHQLMKGNVDLLFLDIRMPVINGLDFIGSLNDPPAVIFTTAYSEYAVSSYELNAVDYLLKPFTFERFMTAVDKYFRNKKKEMPELAYSYFKVNGRLIKIEHADILYAESIRDYILIRTTGGKYITHLTMKSLTALLPPALFARVHRSFLVGRAHVSSIGKKQVAIGSIVIPVGDKYGTEGLGLT